MCPTEILCEINTPRIQGIFVSVALQQAGAYGEPRLDLGVSLTRLASWISATNGHYIQRYFISYPATRTPRPTSSTTAKSPLSITPIVVFSSSQANCQHVYFTSLRFGGVSGGMLAFGSRDWGNLAHPKPITGSGCVKSEENGRRLISHKVHQATFQLVCEQPPSSAGFPTRHLLPPGKRNADANPMRISRPLGSGTSIKLTIPHTLSFWLFFCVLYNFILCF